MLAIGYTRAEGAQLHDQLKLTKQISTTQVLIEHTSLGQFIDALVAAAVKGAPTAYDKAMDAVYLETHVGGGYHRLFDGGHTIVGAIKAAENVAGDDNLIERSWGLVQGLLRDASTPQGLPLVTWSKDTFDAVADKLDSMFSIPKGWFVDINTWTTAELFSASIGVFALIYSWNDAGVEQFAEQAASSALVSVTGGNPLLFMVSLAASAKAFQMAHQSGDWTGLADGCMKGTIHAAAPLAVVALLSSLNLPVATILLAGITTGVVARSVVADRVSVEEIASFVERAATLTQTQLSFASGSLPASTVAASRQMAAGLALAASSVGGKASSAASSVGGKASSAAAVVGDKAVIVASVAGSKTANAASAIGSGAMETGRRTQRATRTAAQKAIRKRQP